MDKEIDIVHLGVSGHRFLDDLPALINSIQKVLDNFNIRHKNSEFQIISPLAVGADQLVTECVLEHPAASLTVLLPMPLKDYLEEFSESEKTMFMRFYNKREKLIQLPYYEKKDEAYLKMGKFLLNSIDYLIVLWNGKPARGNGGTAQIVKLARQRHLPMAWIRAHNAVPGNAIPLEQKFKQGSIEYENWDRAAIKKY
ncbi:MAG: hypothetical protein J7K66_04645 [Anaerolineaceae bacterium]|nr:hypothetical protein [Anaerolineaceae bacterium]